MATGPICHQPASTRDGFDVELATENEVLKGDVTPGPEAGRQTPQE